MLPATEFSMGRTALSTNHNSTACGEEYKYTIAIITSECIKYTHRRYNKTTNGTLNADSKLSHGTVSQFGYAFKAASSLYAPGSPCISQLTS